MLSTCKTVSDSCEDQHRDVKITIKPSVVQFLFLQDTKT